MIQDLIRFHFFGLHLQTARLFCVCVCKLLRRNSENSRRQTIIQLLSIQNSLERDLGEGEGWGSKENIEAFRLVAKGKARWC